MANPGFSTRALRIVAAFENEFKVMTETERNWLVRQISGALEQIEREAIARPPDQAAGEQE